MSVFILLLFFFLEIAGKEGKVGGEQERGVRVEARGGGERSEWPRAKRGVASKDGGGRRGRREENERDARIPPSEESQPNEIDRCII